MDNILITGVNGFTGSQLAKALNSDYLITGIGRQKFPLKAEYFRYINIENLEQNDVKNINYLIFCHVSSGIVYTQKIYEESISTIIKILNLTAINSINLKGIIYFSSVAIYRGYKGGSVDEFSPTKFESNDFYSLVKKQEEQIIINYSEAKRINYLILRPSAIVGKGFHGNLISKIYNDLQGNTVLNLNNPNIEFNALVSISSIINIVLNFLKNDSILLNKILILSTIDSMPLHRLVDKMKKLSNSESKINWGIVALRGPHLFICKNEIFKSKYLLSINDTLKELY